MMSQYMVTPMNAQAHDPVVWLRAFIFAQLNLGLIDARMAEVALLQVQELAIARQMATVARAGFTPAIQSMPTAKVAPLPAAVNSAFFLWDHYEREGKPLRHELPERRRQREDAEKWTQPLDELLARRRERRAAQVAA